MNYYEFSLILKTFEELNENDSSTIDLSSWFFWGDLLLEYVVDSKCNEVTGLELWVDWFKIFYKLFIFSSSPSYLTWFFAVLSKFLLFTLQFLHFETSKCLI